MTGLIKALKNLGCETSEDFPMSSYTTMRVGGRARLMAFPQNRSALSGALNMLFLEKIPFTVLGAGSNTIVKDNCAEKVIVSTRRLKDFKIERETVCAECGAPLSAVMNTTVKAALSGLEFAAGIPGTVGGAVFMNSGANGGETAEVIESVRIWQDGAERNITADEISPAYRHGGLPPGSVLLSARLRLYPGNSLQSRAIVRESLERRKMSQPVSRFSTGSIFKNPPDIPAGRLLEDLGMKLVSVGAAEFSGVHANFIVNRGGAKASDVLSLISIARDRALAEKGINLETEVCVI